MLALYSPGREKKLKKYQIHFNIFNVTSELDRIKTYTAIIQPELEIVWPL